MKEHPILFASEMVRAILDRLKTQTRRVMVPQPREGKYTQRITEHAGGVWQAESTDQEWRCPYGVPGDRLWVRETWCPCRVYPIYRADCCEDTPSANTDDWNEPDGDKWRPSIHMPRWASRILLEVTDVRVQRVQEISEADAIAEGAPLADNPDFDRDDPMNDPRECHVAGYMKLWDSINAKRGYPWASNPWVWAITYKLLEVKGRLAA